MKDKVQKIREGVVRLKSQLLRGACSSQIAMETSCKEEAYNEVLAMLDTLQEEPISEDLEEAAEEWDESLYRSDAFKAGANWQKKQMMAKAVDGLVTFDYYGNDNKTYGCIVHDPICLDDMGIKDTDKVKIILIKED